MVKILVTIKVVNEVIMHTFIHTMADWKEYLQNIYFDTAHPGSFTSPKKLHAIVRKEGAHNISLHRIKQWLSDQDCYSLHKPVKRRFKRRQFIVKSKKDQIQCDLADVRNLQKDNGKMKYLLFVISSFTRFLWVEMQNYNNTPHSSLRNNMTPAEAMKSSEPLLWKHLYVDSLKKRIRPTKKVSINPRRQKIKKLFKKGDHVRITHLRHQFERSFSEKWTVEVFIVRNYNIRQGIPVYSLEDLMHDPIKGLFQNSELQKVNKNADELFFVEKVIRKERRGKNSRIFVKWYGYPKKFNSFISPNDLKEMSKGIDDNDPCNISAKK